MPKLKTEKQEQKEIIKVENSATFRKAIESGILENLEEAEGWLKETREVWDKYTQNPKELERPGRDDKVISDRERELIRAYRQAGNWQKAKELIENSIHPNNKESRAKKLKEDSGLKYEEI
ncbi:hypothetical protein HY798_02100 [Candidatus Falkowbacteria bacterium]|nr:hypothetical protein [Candidatus Falkowbacteria bacterium]